MTLSETKLSSLHVTYTTTGEDFLPLCFFFISQNKEWWLIYVVFLSKLMFSLACRTDSEDLMTFSQVVGGMSW